tara:strand:- start:249 stop:554 length:306 start_codon:yes stop_codon:yes gene_type:complete
MWFNTLEAPPLPNLLTEFHFKGLDLVLTNVKDQIYCFENRCPHEEAKLSLGCIKDEKIKCALHGYSFNLDSGLCLEEKLKRLETFQVKLQDSLVFVNMEDF